MMRLSQRALSALVLLLPHAALAAPVVSTFKPQFVPPLDVVRFLGGEEIGGMYAVRPTPNATSTVTVRMQDASNLLILQGEAADVRVVEDLIRAADVAPRQILLDAQIVRVNEDRARDAGIEWPSAVDVRGRASWYHRTNDDRTERPEGDLRESRTGDATLVEANAELNATLHLLDQANASRTRAVPRIVTLNNRRATILDGSRTVYLARFSSRDYFFDTDSLDAGITLSVLPSLMESGFLRLNVRAEMSSLTLSSNNAVGKTGQMIDNDVIAKEGEPVLLGGFDSDTSEKSDRKVPILGFLFPYLFSSHGSSHATWRTYLILTPHVVDLAPTVDGSMK